MTSVFHGLTRKKPAWLKRRLTRLGSSVSPGGSDGSTTGNGSSGLQNRESSYQYTYIQLHGLSHPSPFFSRGLVFPKTQSRQLNRRQGVLSSSLAVSC